MTNLSKMDSYAVILSCKKYQYLLRRLGDSDKPRWSFESSPCLTPASLRSLPEQGMSSNILICPISPGRHLEQGILSKCLIFRTIRPRRYAEKAN